jgi:hypothetical protein
VPINAVTGGPAKSDDPSTWADFQTALEGYVRLGCDGIGMCRTGDYIFAELDGALDDDDRLLDFPWASKIYDAVKGRAYMEKSPSGTGIHIVTRGALPPGRRQFDEPGQTHCGYAFYDKNRYFTFTGWGVAESGPIQDLTEELTKLYAELFPLKAGLNGNGHRPTLSLSLSDEELLKRARRAENGSKFSQLWSGDITGYASQSEADLALCRHLAFWTGKDSGRMDTLFRQSGLCRPKWLGREDYRGRTIAAAIEQTREIYNANGRQQGLGAVTPANGDPTSVVKVVKVVPPSGTEKAGEAPHSPGANWPEPPKEEAFYGLAGEWVGMVEPHTEADPAALLIQFLVAFGNLIGRGPYAIGDGAQHFTNLFAVIVGQTSKARKGTSWRHVNAILSKIDETWASARVTSGLSSGEGLIWAVRDEKKGFGKNAGGQEREEQIIDPGVHDKRLLVVEGEFARVLQVGDRHGNILSAVLRDAWDTGELSSMTKNTPDRASAAHISIIGHITRDELRRYLSSTEAGNGFANRFLWVCARRTKCLPHGGRLDQMDFSGLVLRLQNAVKFARTVEKVEQDPVAYALWEKVYPGLSEGHPGLFGAVTSRGEAQVLRLSSLYALLDCSEVVRAEHLMAALAVWEYCEASARFIFGTSLGDATADDILRALRGRPEGMTRPKFGITSARISPRLKSTER